jgi:hypothetical protein
MRISSQNNQFILNLPTDFISKELYEKYQLYIDKNHIPYDNALDYINSTIKEISFPGFKFDYATQTKKRSKQVEFKETGNVYDKINRNIDMTFRSIDSNINYFMLSEIAVMYYLDNDKHYVPPISLSLVDKNGDTLYSIVFKNVLFKSITDLRMLYQSQDFQEKTFTVSFNFVWFDIVWELKRKQLDDGMSIFHLPKYQHCTGKTYR